MHSDYKETTKRYKITAKRHKTTKRPEQTTKPQQLQNDHRCQTTTKTQKTATK